MSFSDIDMNNDANVDTEDYILPDEVVDNFSPSDDNLVTLMEYNADDNKYLNNINTGEKFSEIEIKHFLSQLIELEHKSDGYEYVFRYSYLNISKKKKLLTLMRIIAAIISVLATAVNLTSLSTEISANTVSLTAKIIIYSLIIVTGAAGSINGLTEFIDQALKIEERLKQYKIWETNFNKLSADINEVIDTYFIRIDSCDIKKEITLRLRKNINIEEIFLDANKDFKRSMREAVKPMQKIIKQYAKKFKNNKVLIEVADKNKFIRTKDIIILKYGNKILLEHKDDVTIIIKTNDSQPERSTRTT
jgi:hypothetical protein